MAFDGEVRDRVLACVPLVSKIQRTGKERKGDRTIRAAGLQRVNLRRMKTASPRLLRCWWYVRMPGGNAPPGPPFCL